MKEAACRQSTCSSPCAACKLLRRRCAKDCVLAPYFPSAEPHKFASVHKVFGASNVNKMLQELPPHERNDAVSSMVYEANARLRDPVYGCVGAIYSLQEQLAVLQVQLAVAQAENLRMRMMAHHQQATALVDDLNAQGAADMAFLPDSPAPPPFAPSPPQLILQYRSPVEVDVLFDDGREKQPSRVGDILPPPSVCFRSTDWEDDTGSSSFSYEFPQNSFMINTSDSSSCFS